MNFVLGFYTQISSASPASVSTRSLGCILKPLLTYIHDNRDCRLSLALGSALTDYLRRSYPEMNLLISSLARSGSIELMTMAYNNTVLPLIPHKDRAASVERTTTLIRRTYGVRATSLWCYGQIWAPSVVAMMKTIGLERLVISSYDALNQKSLRPSAVRMNELGRKIDVLLSNDRFCRLVSTYAQNGMTLDELVDEMVDVVHRSGEGEDLVCMINIDQLCQGASYNREDDERLYTVFTRLFEAAEERGMTLTLARDLSVREVGYLSSGWFGRDAYAGGLSSFNELFCLNGSFRYMLGRYLALSEFVDGAKKDRVLRKRLGEQLATLPSGSLFLCDTHASCLSLDEHRQFFHTVLEVEDSLIEAGLKPTCADLDEDGMEEEFCYGRLASAVFSPLGASVCEYSSRELKVNVLDTVAPWSKVRTRSERRRSFVDSYQLGGQVWDLSCEPYCLESVNRGRSDFVFTLAGDDSRPFSVSKHYRLSNQNLYLAHTIVNESGEVLEGNWTTTVYLTLQGAGGYAFEKPRSVLVGSALSGVRNVRFDENETDIQLSFTSTDSFTVNEENRYQSEVTTLGSQQFYLYTKVMLTFPVSLAPLGTSSVNIVTRISSTKEK